MTYNAFFKYLPGEGLSSRKLLFTKGFIVKNSTEITDSGEGQQLLIESMRYQI